MMDEPQYIHGTHEAEQERLAALNRMTNLPFEQFLYAAVGRSAIHSVLEVGSGLGLLVNDFAAGLEFGNIVGVESSPEQIARCRTQDRTVAFTRGDAHHLPFPDNSFDVVYCRYVLEHVADPVCVLREMRRVLKPNCRALTQENNMMMVAFDPDCPRFDALLPKFCELQRRLGGDALIGKRLYSLFHTAGFRDIVLSYQPEIHPANSPTFKPWVDNFISLLDGAAAQLRTNGLATAAEIEAAIAELSMLRERQDATGLFYWNRAVGVK